MTKVNLKFNIIVEFDKAVPPSVWDDFLKVYLQRKFGEDIELLQTFGAEEYVLILKEIISDK